MAGPLPPLVGGMTAVIENLANSSLASKVDLQLFDTKKRTAAGRSVFTAIRTRLALWRSWFAAVKGPDTVAHIHTCSGLSYFLDGAYLLLARMRGVPALMHVHGALFDRFLDGLPVPLRWLAQWIARRATVVVVLSEEWRQKLASRLPGAHLRVLENGVSVPPPGREPRPPEAPLRVLFLGNLGERKGVWELVKAVQAVAVPVQLLLVGGEEDPGIAARIREYVQANALQDKVVLIGPVYGSARFDWLGRADLFALPSRAEGLPVAMLEAMAAALPVIVTPVGAIPSIIEDGVNGLLVPPGDVRALAAAIERLAADDSLRTGIGQKGRQVCVARYGIEPIAARLFDLYSASVATAARRAVA